MTCPECGSTNVGCTGRDDDLELLAYQCNDCGCLFIVGDDVTVTECGSTNVKYKED